MFYRQYVLPRPSYTTSDGCSDNSSCPSHPLAGHKYSVSSGYESMTLNSAEGLPQDEPQTADTEDSGGSQAKSQSTIGKSSMSPVSSALSNISCVYIEQSVICGLVLKGDSYVYPEGKS